MKRRFKRILVTLLIICAIPAIGIPVLYYVNKAPVFFGEVSRDIPYNAKHKLDIYHPTKKVSEQSPAILFIHGGAWIAGTKESINIPRITIAIARLRDLGYTIISPNYTLARDKKSPFPGCIQDGFDVINWINEHADSLQLDMNKFGIIGESAGAHIALMNTFASPQDFDQEYEKLTPKYVVDIYGPTQLYDLYHSNSVDSVKSLIAKLPESLHESLDITKLLFGFDPDEDSIKTRNFAFNYSPVKYISQNNIPALIIHGDNDQIVPIQQSQLLLQNLDSLHSPYEFHLLEGVNHAFIDATDEQKQNIQNWIVDFIVKQDSIELPTTQVQ